MIAVALGGNAISPPRGDLGFDVERELIDRAAAELAQLARAARLLVVHGNGPQVGRLLGGNDSSDPANLDIRVAQTQGELGYLIAEALSRHLVAGAVVAVMTRVLVDPGDPAFAHPSKPIGPVLDVRPSTVASMRMVDGAGWRRVVASPRPLAVIEEAAIAGLLATHHVIAGGGGGVPLCTRGGTRLPCPAVIDKDFVAARLASSLGADQLIFVTDVSHAFDDFGHPDQRFIEHMTVGNAQAKLDAGVFAPGSMAPKIESAIQFVVATSRPATIAALGSLAASLRGASGTTVYP